jgi:DNA repair protein RadC
MLDAARLLGIRVLDHLIVTRRAYFSFSERRLL